MFHLLDSCTDFDTILCQVPSLKTARCIFLLPPSIQHNRYFTWNTDLILSIFSRKFYRAKMHQTSLKFKPFAWQFSTCFICSFISLFFAERYIHVYLNTDFDSLCNLYRKDNESYTDSTHTHIKHPSSIYYYVVEWLQDRAAWSKVINVFQDRPSYTRRTNQWHDTFNYVAK